MCTLPRSAGLGQSIFLYQRHVGIRWLALHLKYCEWPLLISYFFSIFYLPIISLHSSYVIKSIYHTGSLFFFLLKSPLFTNFMLTSLVIYRDNLLSLESSPKGPGPSLCSGSSCRELVLGIKGKYGAVPRHVWVYFLFWGARPTFAALTTKATKRVSMGEIPNYRIWGAPDFCLIPSTWV